MAELIEINTLKEVKKMVNTDTKMEVWVDYLRKYIYPYLESWNIYMHKKNQIIMKISEKIYFYLNFKWICE